MFNPLELGPVSLTCPAAPPGQLLFRRMSAREELGRPFVCELELYSRLDSISLHGLLGQPMAVGVDIAPAGKRYWHGIITRASYVGVRGEYNVYRLTLRPWLWLLTKNVACKVHVPGREKDENGNQTAVHQTMTVPEIILAVFRSHGLTDFETHLSGEYRPWDQVIQYRESDFNFVSRLMEQEGIYYYFKHEETKHTLVLADSPAAHEPVPGYERIPFFPPSANRRRERDHIEDWSVGRQMQPRAVALTDYDFERSRAGNLFCRSPVAAENATSPFEVYDYPGHYAHQGLVGVAEGQAVEKRLEHGDFYARTRREELIAQQERMEGAGNARGLRAGATFRLTGHPRDDQNREYLLVSAHYEVRSYEYGTGGGDSNEDVFRCHFTVLDSQVPFRPARSTPRAAIPGPQTAKVVGPEGQEIHTDKYGRVKVKFRWDLDVKEDQDCSAWARVAQIWAGQKFGGMFIPRIGQEVIVDFLEGDPDKPLVVGRLYNEANMPPYGLPDSMTQSGIKSRSTPGGAEANANEIRFEDKKGEEHFFMQAEKDMNVTVKAAQSIGVGGDRSVTTTGKETYTVKKTRDLTVEKKDTEKFNDGREVTVKTEDKETIDGGAHKLVKVTGNYHVTTAELKIGIGGEPGADAANQILLKDKVEIKTAGVAELKNEKTSLKFEGDDATLTATGKITLTANGAELKLVCGSSSITLKSGGVIEITGSQVTSTGGASSVDIAGAGVTVTGTTVKLNS